MLIFLVGRTVRPVPRSTPGAPTTVVSSKSQTFNLRAVRNTEMETHGPMVIEDGDTWENWGEYRDFFEGFSEFSGFPHLLFVGKSAVFCRKV